MNRISEGQDVLRLEAKALIKLSERLDEKFSEAVEKILQCQGKLILCGIGKSGLIARKISSTFSSTGTPSTFLHPAEGVHGDLGLISKNDLVLMISYGGGSEELFPVMDFATRHSVPVILMSGNPSGPLAQGSEVILDIQVDEEACPLKLAPTASSTATLALGDALAMVVLKERGFKESDFADFHPGGKLGRRLLTRVKDLMHAGDSLPLVGPDEPISRVVATMTSKDVRGVAGVVDSTGRLIGVITDGAIRRRLEKSSEPFTELAKDLMNLSPKTIDQSELAQKALFLMEQFKINVLFAVDKSGVSPESPVGLIHVQDLIAAKI